MPTTFCFACLIWLFDWILDLGSHGFAYALNPCGYGFWCFAYGAIGLCSFRVPV